MPSVIPERLDPLRAPVRRSGGTSFVEGSREPGAADPEDDSHQAAKPATSASLQFTHQSLALGSLLRSFLNIVLTCAILARIVPCDDVARQSGTRGARTMRVWALAAEGTPQELSSFEGLR